LVDYKKKEGFIFKIADIESSQKLGKTKDNKTKFTQKREFKEARLNDMFDR